MAEMNLNPREKARLEEEKKNRKTRNKFILVGVIVVLMIALVIFVNSRLFYNVTTALTIGDTNYSVARMNYEYQKAYMNFNQTYGQYFGSLIDTSKSLKEQSCPFDANGGTWDDYFKQSAETNLTQLSAVYAKAIAEGYALTEDEAAEIDTAVESYRTYGKSIGFATLNKFLSAYFGTGNSEKTIRANMAEELIASRYADDVYASFTYTDDEIDAYYAENADSYDRVNVLYTLISMPIPPRLPPRTRQRSFWPAPAARRKTSAPLFSRRPRLKPPKRATPSPPSSAAMKAAWSVMISPRARCSPTAVIPACTSFTFSAPSRTTTRR